MSEMGKRPRTRTSVHAPKTGVWAGVACMLLWVWKPELAETLSGEAKALILTAFVTLQQALGSQARDMTHSVANKVAKPWWYWPVDLVARLL